MKKIFYLIAALGLSWGVVSCDNEPKNPGDHSVVADVTFGNFVSVVSGETFPIEYAKVFDTIFQYEVPRYDSIFNEDGEFERRQLRDTIIVPATFKTRWYEAKPLEFSNVADTVEIPVFSNARWKCLTTDLTQEWPTVEGPAQWGNGDGSFKLNLGTNRWKFNVKGTLVIHTSDSTLFYSIPIVQYPAQ